MADESGAGGEAVAQAETKARTSVQAKRLRSMHDLPLCWYTPLFYRTGLVAASGFAVQCLELNLSPFGHYAATRTPASKAGIGNQEDPC